MYRYIRNLHLAIAAPSYSSGHESFKKNPGDDVFLCSVYFLLRSFDTDNKLQSVFQATPVQLECLVVF